MKHFIKFRSYSPVCFLILLFCAPVALAQNVDFELPTEINVIQGRLAVAFNEGIAEQEAADLIESLGYGILQTNFTPLMASAATPESIAEEKLETLRKNSLVLEIETYDLQAMVDSPINSTRDVSTAKRYKTQVQFQTHVTMLEALRLLSETTGVDFEITNRPANEIIIDVGDDDETAFSQLDGHAKVKWVTYVGEADY